LTRCRLRHSFLILACLCLAGLTNHCLAGTTHIREFAKNKPKVFIIVSGPQALETGRGLQNAILRYPDNRHDPNDIPILSIAQATAQAGTNSEFSKSPLVFLLVGGEMSAPLPSSLNSLLPFPLPDPSRKINLVTSSLSGQKRNQVFTVGMFAPDADRLRKLYGIFLARESDNFRTLPFEEEHRSNRLTVFSAPANRELVANWGLERDPHVWNDIQWHDLAERDAMPPEQMEERVQVYFLSRAQNDAVPSAAAPIITTHSLKPTTIVIERQQPMPGVDMVVFSTPSRAILEKKARHYPTLAALVGLPAVDEAVDLRAVKHTVLLMSGSIPDGDREQVRLLLAKDMRQGLGMEVEERGPVMQVLQHEVTLEQLQGASDTSRMLRRKAGLRYVWHFGVTDYSGSTEYQPEEKRITPTPSPFAESEPTEPNRSKGLFRGNKSDEEHDKDMSQFQRDHETWQEKKNEYDQRIQNTSFQWSQQIDSHSNAHIHGVLTLFDIQSDNGGKVIWQHDCNGADEQRGVLRMQHASVQGLDSRPSSLEVPAASDTCSLDLLHGAVRDASRGVFEALQETALLPSAGGSLSSAELASASGPASGGPGGTATTLVAAVQDGIVTLTAGAAQGLHVGSRVFIPIKTRQITDPATGAVIDTRVLDRIALRVSSCGATADCVPATAADGAKLSQVKVGMPARWSASAPPTPPRKAHRQ